MDKIFITGNLGGDPELRYTKTGTPIASFSLAAERRVKNPDGNWVNSTVWYKCSVFGKRAEAVSNYLAKGDGVAIEGELSFDPVTGSPKIWVGRDGNPRTSFDVRVLDWSITNHRSGKKPAVQQGDAQQWQQPATQPPAQQWQQPATQPPAQQWQQPATQPPAQPKAVGVDDEIPF